MFISGLFTIDKLWNQPRCLSADAWIKKMQYTDTMLFYSATKKKEIMSFARKWIIILSETCQTQKDKYCILSFICGS